jgi:hypothetical protein
VKLRRCPTCGGDFRPTEEWGHIHSPPRCNSIKRQREVNAVLKRLEAMSWLPVGNFWNLLDRTELPLFETTYNADANYHSIGYVPTEYKTKFAPGWAVVLAGLRKPHEIGTYGFQPPLYDTTLRFALIGAFEGDPSAQRRLMAIHRLAGEEGAVRDFALDYYGRNQNRRPERVEKHSCRVG